MFYDQHSRQHTDPGLHRSHSPHIFELTLQLSQPLYTWGKLKGSVDLAALQLEVSKAELAEVQRRLHQDLHKAYFTGVLARDSARLLERILDILVEIEQDSRRAFDLGAVALYTDLDREGVELSSPFRTGFPPFTEDELARYLGPQYDRRRRQPEIVVRLGSFRTQNSSSGRKAGLGCSLCRSTR